jgi:hypothetical protein
MQALKQSIEKAKPKQKAAPAQRKQKPLRQIRNTLLFHYLSPIASL